MYNNYTRVENFEGGKFRAIPDFALFRKFRGPTSTCIIFVSSATHEKREIKTTSKFSTRTVYYFVFFIWNLFEIILYNLYKINIKL